MGKAAAILTAVLPGLIILRGACKGVDPYRAFVKGAAEGFASARNMLPALAAMMLMLEMISRSGIGERLIHFMSPVMSWLNLPPETAPMLVLRPLTGSGSLSALEGIFKTHGPDSRIGMIASVLMASTETVFYTLTVYLSAAGVKHLPWVVPVSLISGVAGAWACGFIL